MNDLTYAARTLTRTPLATTMAVLSLALGIGANAAIYSLFDQMVRSPLPVRHPDELVNLGTPGPKPGRWSCNDAGDCDHVFSYPMFRDLEREQKVLAGLAAHRSFGANLALEGRTERGTAMATSGSYFPVLGLSASLGRLLAPSDDDVPGAHPVAVLSHAFWRTRLGSDPNVLNQTIVINGQPFTVVGVGPRGFRGTTLGTSPDVFVPMSMMAQVGAGVGSLDSRRDYWVYVFGRLKPGGSLERARAGLDAVYRPIVREVEAPLQRSMTERSLAEFRDKRLSLEPGGHGQSEIRDQVRTPMALLLAITTLVLMIACANIANLLLARGSTRSMEMAVRLSLGASRARVVRQLLAESLLLAAIGGAASLLVATWTLSGIAAILPPDATAALQPSVRPAAVLFTGFVAIATGFLFGLFPALHGTRLDLVKALRASGGQVGVARSAARFRTALVTAQIALSMTLLISAGLFIRSLVNVSRVDLGVRIDNLMTFGVWPELSGYPPARSRQFFQRLATELAAVPGVTAVASSTVPILASSSNHTTVSVEGFEAPPDANVQAATNEVSPGYFRALGVPLIAGREFTSADDASAPRVAIVNKAFVKKFALGRDAVGSFMALGRTDSLNIRIVGVVQDAKYSEVKDAVPAQFMTPHAQDTTLGSMTFYVRSSLPTDQTARVIRSTVSALDPNLPVDELKTMPQQVRENITIDRLISTLSAAFAALATLLAAIGLYGVLAFTVANRTREFGLRMAVGADAASVRRLVLRQVGRMVVMGGLLGGAAALVLGRYAESLLYELHARDPLVFLIASSFLALVVFAAALVPAMRASRVHPMQALRYE